MKVIKLRLTSRHWETDALVTSVHNDYPNAILASCAWLASGKEVLASYDHTANLLQGDGTWGGIFIEGSVSH
eukprot:5089257-Amphidinium_carterae.2